MFAVISRKFKERGISMETFVQGKDPDQTASLGAV